MPLLVDDTTEQVNTHRSNYKYSASKLDELGSDRYTLVQLECDVSGSVAGFKEQLERCVAAIAEGCFKSPEANNLLLRVTTFNDSITEIHGFKELANVNPGDYLGTFKVGGSTALRDAMHEGNEVQRDFGERLTKSKYKVNGIKVTITDGWDMCSVHTLEKIRSQFDEMVRGEHMESLLSILIGVNIKDANIALKLQNLKDGAGIMQFEKIEDATPETFARIANFVVKSVSSQSNSLGTNSASVPLKF